MTRNGQIRRSGLTVASGARTGAVTLIQRFGSALNLNIHLHMLFLDGAYTFHGNRPTFHRSCRPAAEELNRLLDSLSRRIVWVLERRGLLVADPVHPHLDLSPVPASTACRPLPLTTASPSDHTPAARP